MCQCPLGLIPHCYAGLYVREAVIEVSMPSRAYTSLLPQKGRKDKYAINVGVNALSGLYLIVTTVKTEDLLNPRTGCQCPLGLIPHCYSTPSKT